MNKIFAVMALVAAAGTASADVITQWNFNSNPSDANTGTGVTAPVIGAGTIAVFGGVTQTFASGDASGGSSDANVGDDSAFNTTTYAAQGTGSGTRGFGVTVSTLGFQGISFEFDRRTSNTSSRYVEVLFDAGSGFQSAGFAGLTPTAGDTWQNNLVFALPAAADNVAALTIRVVAVFESVATGNANTNYVASNPTAAYATSGTLRYDMVEVLGSRIPTPASAALLGMGLAFAGGRRRR